jgi:hypothetical protein
MRNHLIFFAFLFLPLFGFAQSKPVKEFYDKYKSLENVTDVKLQGWVIRLASSFADEAEAERLLNKITHLRVMVMEQGNLVSPVEYKELVRKVKSDSFEELLKVKDSGEQVEFLIREKNNAVTDVLILVNGANGFVLLSLEGNLKFSDLQDLNIQIDGAEHFKKLPKDKKEIPRA